jgi:polysaccharide biosynthesis/export protein
MDRDLHAIRVLVGVALLSGALGTCASAQQPKPAATAPNGSKPVVPPSDYVIGIEDVLTIVVYGQDPMHTGDVVVRPDGKISRLMIDEVRAAGLTTAQLKDELTKAYSKFFQEPMILVTPKQINSRKVYISGMVAKPGTYPLNEPLNLLQLIAIAGGLLEYADKEHIVLIRKEPLSNGKLDRTEFNYNKLFQSNAIDAIPQLRPGDQVFIK